MRSARFLSHMNHVSVSPTDGNGPTQGQRKTLTTSVTGVRFHESASYRGSLLRGPFLESPEISGLAIPLFVFQERRGLSRQTSQLFFFVTVKTR